MIFQNKPYITGQEFKLINEAISNRHLSGNGAFTNKCHSFFQNKYKFKKTLLTTSCTDALEMCSILLDLQPGDEVIMPSFTFVSTANAFVLRGAKIIVGDSEANNPNIDADKIEPLITPKTKAIVVVHYAGVACNMEVIMALASKYSLIVIEDAAQAVDAYHLKNGIKVPVGSIGHLAAFSFHESKNIQCGEGGMLVINDNRFVKRAEIIWEKGTNRAAFFRGEVDKYNWVDMGSSFLPSEINAAFLYAQLQEIDFIQRKRNKIWSDYYQRLLPLSTKGFFELPQVPENAIPNGHIFYIVCNNSLQRDGLINYLKGQGVQAMFHYPGLHKSPFFNKLNNGVPQTLPFAEKFSDGLVRLPLYVELTDAEVALVCDTVEMFFKSK